MIERIKNLQTATQAKLLLEELANLRDEAEASRRFWERFQNFFQPGAFRVNEIARSQWAQVGDQPVGVWTTATPLSTEGRSQMLHEELSRMRDLLREAWEINDLRRKEWKLFQLREKFHQMTVADENQMSEPPPPSGIDFALRYLLRVMHKARTCENPECKSRRYFISDRRARRFCSDACAKPAQSEYKSEWWLENRDRLSRARREKYRESKKRKRERRP
jgi:hypothetical protein